MVRRLKGAAPCFGRNRITQVLRTHDSGARLVLDGRDANLERPWHFVPLHAPHSGPAIRFGADDFGPQTAREYAAGTVVGKSKTHRGAVDRFPAFVRDLHG